MINFGSFFSTSDDNNSDGKTMPTNNSTPVTPIQPASQAPVTTKISQPISVAPVKSNPIPNDDSAEKKGDEIVPPKSDNKPVVEVGTFLETEAEAKEDKKDSPGTIAPVKEFHQDVPDKGAVANTEVPSEKLPVELTEKVEGILNESLQTLQTRISQEQEAISGAEISLKQKEAELAITRAKLSTQQTEVDKLSSEVTKQEDYIADLKKTLDTRKAKIQEALNALQS